MSTSNNTLKERTEQQLEEERQRRIAEGGIIWPVWSWITSGSQPGDATSGRAFSVVSDKIKATVFFIVIWSTKLVPNSKSTKKGVCMFVRKHSRNKDNPF